MEDELKLVEELAGEYPKSYQVWHYRQAIASGYSEPQREMAFINEMLDQDSKNYHAWSYRQHVVKTFALWDEELVDTARLLDEDIRNNSAWNQRYFVFSTRRSFQVEAEIQFVLERIRIVPNNESPWVYLKGIVHLANKRLSDYKKLVETIHEFADAPHRIPFALALLNYVYKEQGDKDSFHKVKKIKSI